MRYPNDILRFSGGDLYFHGFHINPATGTITPIPYKGHDFWGRSILYPTPKDAPADFSSWPSGKQDKFINRSAEFTAGLECLLDSYWMQHPPMPCHSGRLRFGPVFANLWAWNDTTAIGSDNDGHACFAITRAKLDELQKNLWTSTVNWKSEKCDATPSLGAFSHRPTCNRFPHIHSAITSLPSGGKHLRSPDRSPP